MMDDEVVKNVIKLQLEKASPKDIAKYLDHLLDIAYANYNGDYEHQVWKALYDCVFSDVISKRIFERFPTFTYADPDTTYYEDVIAFISAFKEYANSIYEGQKDEQSWFPTFSVWAKNENNKLKI